jgi:site-specific recombinase XerD
MYSGAFRRAKAESATMTDSIAISTGLILLPAEAVSSRRLDPKVITEFSQRSVSEETRRAYRRVVHEFFRFVSNRHPAEISPADVQRWRDQLIADKKSASTITFKLSVIRSLFDYLKIAGIVSSNPALAKLVQPPKLSEDLRGRALTAKEVGLCWPARIALNPKARVTTPCCC